MASDKALVGAAGEYLVLSRLLAQGLLASPAPRGTEKVDIVVSDKDGKSSFRIQVKTTEGSAKGGWVLGKKHELQAEKDLYFCFVVLHKTSPEVYIIPSSVVAKAISSDHSDWLGKTPKNGKPHKDTEMRKLRAVMPLQKEGWLDQYRENWSAFL